MALIGSSTIKSVIVAIEAYFRWKAISTEIEAKRLIVDELERVKDETTKLEDEIEFCRASGNFTLADRMLERAAGKATLSVGLVDIAKRAGVHSGSGHDTSGRECHTEKRTDDIGLNRGGADEGSKV